MDGDIDLILVANLFEALVEVFHVLDQQSTGEVEVSLLVFAVVNDVDHYRVLEVGPLDVVKQIGRRSRGRGGATSSGVVVRGTIVSGPDITRTTGSAWLVMAGSGQLRIGGVVATAFGKSHAVQ